jgi:uncharacterized protein (TIGR02145 family)
MQLARVGRCLLFAIMAFGCADWWSASEYRSDYAYNWGMGYEYKFAGGSNYDKSAVYSVRCVQD